jgi:D-sedoheptulose 7-phosphate isomerase
MAAEFSGKLSRPRKPLASIALGTNNSSMSAIGNDFGFVEVFARELEAYSNPNSVVIAFSTSGTSDNILRLWEKSKELGLTFRAFTGSTHGKLDPAVAIRVPSLRTERVQEMHTTLGHLLCLLIEEELGIFGSNS